MAAACTSMEVHDPRLSISKASASKISKPSASPLLKSLSAAASAPPSASSSPPSSSSASSSAASATAAASASTSPPRMLPSSITSSPSRPIAKVVNADPSSFRRVVQELTGTTSSSSTAGVSPRAPSRLQRIAPPPLRTAIRISQSSPPPPPPPQQQQQQSTLSEQMQASHTLHLHHQNQQQHITKVGLVSSSPLSFPDPTSSFISKPTSQFRNPNLTSGSVPAPHLGNPNPDFSQSLPMLSPHLLSPLPALSPGDNTWANPLELLPPSPKYVLNTSNPLPPLLPMPSLSTGLSSNSYGNALLPRSTYASYIPSGGTSATLTTPSATGPLVVSSSVSSSQVQLLSPSLPTPMQAATFSGVLPPWSPSPLPFSPGPFPPSPGLVPPLSPLPLPSINDSITTGHQQCPIQHPQQLWLYKSHNA